MAYTKDIPLIDKLQAGKVNGIRFDEHKTEITKRYLSANKQQQFKDVSELFFYLLDKAANAPENNTVSETENKRLQTELTAALAERDNLKQQVLALKTEIENNTPAPVIPENEPAVNWDILNRLDIPADFRKPEHKDAVDTIAYYVQQTDSTILQLMHDPLQLIKGEEYEALKKWDAEVFLPAMRELTGITDLELSSREKFLLILDYAQADPALSLADICLKVSAADAERIKNCAFPRAEKVKEILIEKKLLDAVA